MLFQGQELVEGSWFSDEDGARLDAPPPPRRPAPAPPRPDLAAAQHDRRRRAACAGRNVDGPPRRTPTRGVLAWHRWLEGGPRDDVIVLASFSADAYPDYHIGVPRPGRWRVRFNSDWDGYDPEFETVDSIDADSEAVEQDGMPQRIEVGLGPYSVVILSARTIRSPPRPGRRSSNGPNRAISCGSPNRTRERCHDVRATARPFGDPASPRRRPPPIVPNILRDPAAANETALAPKRRPRGVLVGGIMAIAGIGGSLGAKLLFGLLAANVAGAAASALFGGPWDKLPGDVKNAYEQRLETAIGHRLDGMANAQQETQVAAWLRSGYSRLDDRRLTRHLELEVDALIKADVGTCATFGRSSISGTPIDSSTSNKIVGSLDQASMVEFLGLNVEAIEAELRGSPTPIHVTSAQTSAELPADDRRPHAGRDPHAREPQLRPDGQRRRHVQRDPRPLPAGAPAGPASKAIVARFDIDPS